MMVAAQKETNYYTLFCIDLLEIMTNSEQSNWHFKLQRNLPAWAIVIRNRDPNAYDKSALKLKVIFHNFL